MFPIWAFISLGAAFAQAIRFMIQKQLSVSTLSPAGATFARFLYSAPLVAVFVGVYAWFIGQPLPHMGLDFWVFVLIGGASQIIATVCTVALFKRRNFAVGVTFAKTEVLFSVVLGFFLLSDGISLFGFSAILIGLIGVLILSNTDFKNGLRILNIGVLLGLASGVLFAISAVNYRGAALSLDDGDFIFRGTLTLACVTTVQMLGMTVYLIVWEQGQINRVLASWQKSSLIGFTSMIGSAAWFTAFALQSVAYVKAVGQVEVLFSIVIGALVFGERISKREYLGIGLVVLSVVFLVIQV